MLTIGLYPNMLKAGIVDVVQSSVQYLVSRGVHVVIPRQAAIECGQPELGCDRDSMPQIISLGVTLGGDGTILHVARELARAKIPVCGINMGNLGFLTAAELSEMYSALANLLTGCYLVEDRMMLKASVVRQGEVLYQASALNDVVLTSGVAHRLIRLNVHVDDELIASYPADGFILATPTGATGYSLSAGGPIVNPRVEAIVLTPICPHTLYSRSLVISRSEQVKITHPGKECVAITIDGQSEFVMNSGDILLVSEAEEKARLVRFSDKSYYLTLRSKLRRGEMDAAN